jgi:hypothetical protein
MGAEQWALIKRQILSSDPKSLKDTYTQKVFGIDVADSVTVGLNISINGQETQLRWDSGLVSYLPQKLQDLIALCRSLGFRL